MAELNFPKNPSLKPEYTSESGITYYWDETSSSWLMLSSQSVTRNYVDSRDQLRYRRDGADFIFGDVIIKENNDLTSQTTVRLTTEGTFSLAKEATLNFSPIGGDGEGGSITFGNLADQKEIIKISAEFVQYRKPLRFNVDDTKKLCRLEVNGQPEVFLYDISQVTSNSIPSDYIVRMPNSDKSAFVVKGHGSDSEFRVKGDGQVVVSHDKSAGLVVKSSAIDYAFKVDPNTHKVFTSEAYASALLSGGGGVVGPDGNSQYQLMEEPNLVATKSYVDSLVQDFRGQNLTADTEDGAKPGGFWRSGNSLYWKL